MGVSSPIAVLVINLDKRDDRLAAVKHQTDALGLSFTRISAVDGRTVPEAELSCSLARGPIGDLPATTRACTASHVKAWRHILDSGAAYALVLEDDVALHGDIAALLGDASWIPPGVDLLKLEKFAPRRPSKILVGRVIGRTPNGEIRRMYSRHTGSAAYILSRKGAEMALARSGTFDVPVDHLLFNETASSLCAALGPAIMVPPLAWQDDSVGSGSDIAPLRRTPPAPGRGAGWAKAKQSLGRVRLEMRLLHVQLFRLLTGQARVVTLRTPHSRGAALPGILRKLGWTLPSTAPQAAIVVYDLQRVVPFP